MNRFGYFLSFALTVVLGNIAHGAVVHSEFLLNGDGSIPTNMGDFVYTAIGGNELSGDPDAPTPVTVSLGDNTVYGIVDNAPRVTFDDAFFMTVTGDDYDTSTNVDIFTFTVAPGQQWTSLVVAHYDNPVDGVAFLAINDSNTFPVNAIDLGLMNWNPTTDQYLGGTTFGSAADVGEDIMPRLANSGMIPGSFGFVGPLGPGDYSIHVQQIGGATPYGLTVGITTVVPEPTAAGFLILGFALSTFRRRRAR